MFSYLEHFTRKFMANENWSMTIFEISTHSFCVQWCGDVLMRDDTIRLPLSLHFQIPILLCCVPNFEGKNEYVCVVVLGLNCQFGQVINWWLYDVPNGKNQHTF